MNALAPRPVLLAFGLQLALALLAWSIAGSAVVPGPGEVARAFGELWAHEGLARELGVSLLTSLEALSLSTALSLLLAWSSGSAVARPMITAVTGARFLGLAGCTFVFTLLFGGGHALKVALLVAGVTPFVATALHADVQSIDARRFDHARTLRLSPLSVWFEVVVRGRLEHTLEVVRQNAAIAWTLLTLVEGLVRSEGGVGALLLNQARHLHLAQVFAVQLSILAVGLGQDAALVALRRAACPHTVRRPS